MKKAILRNVAVVSAVFVLTFSIMLITNYFQVKGVHPLQAEVIETLKQINDEHANNVELQEQIRQLDLLARKAYFIRLDHLMTGVYILIAALAVFIVTLRLYYAEDKTIPGKQVAPVDEWVIKTHSRRYIHWITSSLVVAALVFVFLSSPYMSMNKGKSAKDDGASDLVTDVVSEQISENENYDSEYSRAFSNTDAASESASETGTSADTGTSSETRTSSETSAVSETSVSGIETAVETTPDTASGTVSEMASSTAGGASSSPTTPGTTSGTAPESPAGTETSKVTHNGFRGNNSNAISSARGIPTQWDLESGENIAWKSDIPKHGYNSPVING
ncbi:MAG: hypothetical protein LBG28_10145, partial [Tannerella sp.]|nr:hypothetical protein [Tannerella sp.]